MHACSRGRRSGRCVRFYAASAPGDPRRHRPAGRAVRPARRRTRGRRRGACDPAPAAGDHGSSPHGGVPPARSVESRRGCGPRVHHATGHSRVVSRRGLVHTRIGAHGSVLGPPHVSCRRLAGRGGRSPALDDYSPSTVETSRPIAPGSDARPNGSRSSAEEPPRRSPSRSTTDRRPSGRRLHSGPRGRAPRGAENSFAAWRGANRRRRRVPSREAPPPPSPRQTRCLRSASSTGKRDPGRVRSMPTVRAPAHLVNRSAGHAGSRVVARAPGLRESGITRSPVLGTPGRRRRSWLTHQPPAKDVKRRGG